MKTQGTLCAKLLMIWRLAKHWLEDLCYKSYSLHKGQFMSEATKKVQCEKARALLNHLRKPPAPDMLIFFSDDKNLTQDQKVNP